MRVSQEDEREREEVRRRLWRLIKIEGAVCERTKVQAREALSSGNMEAALKIIEQAELQVDRMKASPAHPFTRTPTVGSLGSDATVGTDAQVQTAFVSPPRSPLRPSTARMCQDSHVSATRGRPATAHACLQQNVQSRRKNFSSTLSASYSIGEGNKSLDMNADALENEACKTSSSDDNEAIVSEGYKVLESAPLAEEDKVKHRVKNEKQKEMERWLRLADAGEEADKVFFERIDLQYSRLAELPEWFLVPELRVRVVSLRKNTIPSISDSFCTQLPFLEEVDLGYNMLSSLPQTFGSLRNLKKLFLNENRLRGLPFSLGSLSKLQVLNIEKNSITRLPCSLLSVGATLTNLLTRGNPPFIQPPQKLIDNESLFGIREHLAAVFIAGKVLSNHF